MYGWNKEYEAIIESCFGELRGTFSQEQSFYIILGVSSITWVNLNDKYNTSNLKHKRYLHEYGSFMFLQDELKQFEYEFPEFKGILTGMMDKVLIYKDKSENKKLRHIFQIVESANFSTDEEVRMFINQITSYRPAMFGFNQTPDSVKEIIVGLMDFGKVRTFADYCSGMSGVAIHIFERMAKTGRDRMNRELHYYGEEMNVTNFLISKLLMIVNGIDNYEIVNKDALSDESSERDLKFDFIVSDFPQVVHYDMGYRYNDPRLKYGIPTRSSADWAFCQIVLHHLKENGKGVVIGTMGTLVRSNEAHIRKGIVEDDLIESIITLPTNLYEKSGIGTEIIIFNTNKDRARRNKVLFINASDYSYRINKNQHAVSPEGINKILEYYHHGIEEDHFSKFVDIEKIREYNYTLNPKEYLDFDVLKSTFEHSVKLKNIAEITRGVQVSKSDMEMLSAHPTHYFLNVKDIDNGRIYYDETAKLTNKKADWLGKFDIKPNDIILTSKGSTVRVAIVEEHSRPAFISSNLTRIRVDPRKYNPYVLYEFLQSEIGVKMLEGIQTGTTIKLLNTSQLERLQVPLFDIEFMDDIGNDIRRNKFDYEKVIEEAIMRFEHQREELTSKLRLSISKK
ncbi:MULTISPECIES: N-6 DNA methylase [Bacillaceae]|uniref:site-specific DNA-methyltransferase (adenine-specific) n=1 Tax=Evansella alkalicola TaxID=745819 RepID=A0ABS6JYC2_9BACI|nr:MULTISPECIES: N-6 DNA methylase [Bacillaceae]MBU9723091.1 N-6 DNA methylase [Bacillus alkalicola]